MDLHVLAASHRNLREMIARGTFREDLYYRLNGITLELPALRERTDKERLIQHALAAETGNGRPAAIERDALQRLLTYSWPGNIRELRNVIRTALAICEGGVVRGIDLPREIRDGESLHEAQQDGIPCVCRCRRRPVPRRRADEESSAAVQSPPGSGARRPVACHGRAARQHEPRRGGARRQPQHPVPQNQTSRHRAGQTHLRR